MEYEMPEMKAKTASLVSKVIALAWIIVGETLIGLEIFKGLDWVSVIIIGCVMAVVFISTDISLILKNVSAGKIDLTGAVPKDDK
jgi:hypothetical protein